MIFLRPVAQHRLLWGMAANAREAARVGRVHLHSLSCPTSCVRSLVCRCGYFVPWAAGLHRQRTHSFRKFCVGLKAKMRHQHTLADPPTHSHLQIEQLKTLDAFEKGDVAVFKVHNKVCTMPSATLAITLCTADVWCFSPRTHTAVCRTDAK
jgi:hypothetical protein